MKIHLSIRCVSFFHFPPSSKFIHPLEKQISCSIQVQELSNKQHHFDGHQRVEHEYKSLRKEHATLKSKSSRIIDELEKRFSMMTEQVEQMQKLFQEQLTNQQKKIQFFEKESQEHQRLKQLFVDLSTRERQSISRALSLPDTNKRKSLRKRTRKSS